MKKKSSLLTVLFSVSLMFVAGSNSYSQEIVITNPDGLNSLWSKIPDNGTVKEGEVDLVGNTQPECAGLALRRFKRNINQLSLNKGFKDVVGTGFTALGLVVPSGYAKYALLALKMTYKAMSADSPEEFENEAVKETIKQIGGAGINIKNDKLLEKTLKEAFKKIVDAIFKTKKDIFNKPLDFAPCKNGSVVITLDPPSAGSTDMVFTLSFTMDEECDCQYPGQSISGSTQKLKKYSIWGSMPMTVKEIDFEEVSFHVLGRQDKIKLTLEYGTPVYHVSADCDCGNVSYTDNTSNCSYKAEITGGYSYLSGQVGDDMTGFPAGGNLSLIYHLNPHFGAGADFSYHRRKKDYQTFSRSFILAKGQYTFGDAEDCDKNFQVEAHLLCGIGLERVKFTAGSYSNTSKGSGFAFGAGLGGEFKITSSIGVKLQTDFIGVKYKNADELSKNLRGNVGVYYLLTKAFR